MKTALMTIGLVVLIGFATPAFSAHQEEKTAPKGTVTQIAVSEYEVTIKDDKGKETRVKVKEISDVVVGDSVVVTKDGALKKSVKPKTGGY